MKFRDSSLHLALVGVSYGTALAGVLKGIQLCFSVAELKGELESKWRWTNDNMFTHWDTPTAYLRADPLYVNLTTQCWLVVGGSMLALSLAVLLHTNYHRSGARVALRRFGASLLLLGLVLAGQPLPDAWFWALLGGGALLVLLAASWADRQHSKHQKNPPNGTLPHEFTASGDPGAVQQDPGKRFLGPPQ